MVLTKFTITKPSFHEVDEREAAATATTTREFFMRDEEEAKILENFPSCSLFGWWRKELKKVSKESKIKSER